MRRVLAAYSVAFVVSALATLAAIGSSYLLPGQPPYAIFYAAVAITSWYGGLGPGLLSTVLCSLAIDYYIEDPVRSLGVTSVASGLRLGAFVLVALLIGALQGRLRAEADRARRGELRASELAAIVSSSDDAIVGLTLDGVVTTWNAGAEALLGHRAVEMVGRHVRELAADPKEAEMPGVLRRIAAGGRFGHYESVWLDRENRHLAVSVTLSPVRTPDGRVIGASAIARDVTRRKLAEETHARLAAVVAASADAIVGADGDGTITSWSPGAQRLYGHHMAEVVGTPLTDRLVGDELRRWEQALNRLRAGDDAVSLTLRLLHRDGHAVESSLVVCPVRDSAGAIVGISLVGRGAAASSSPRWEALIEVARAYSRQDDPDRLAEVLIREVIRATGADSAGVLRFDEASGLLTPLATAEQPAQRGIPLADSGAAGRTIVDRRPVVLNDYGAAGDASPAAVAAGVQAAIAAPILVGGTVLGVLTASTRRPGARFAPEDAALLEALVPVAAACLRAARPPA